ncbi:hypothetical protein [Nocardia sp. R7R-8]|uniref:hypothetical protein n=1 Tax=Nocardia sp. R7R-8 TaxID=3459304 RepID=UPI00403D582A
MLSQRPPLAGYLRSEFSKLAPLEILQAPISALLGLPLAAAAILTSEGLETIFDLACSRVFGDATLLSEAAENPRSALARYGMAPAEIVENLPPGSSIEDLAGLPISALEGIDPARAPEIENALNVETVRDLALWPSYLAARDIYMRVLTPEDAPDADPDAPADLLPTSGDFPTERVFYSTLVFDGNDTDREIEPLEEAGPIDLSAIVGENFGFKTPGIGALLMFSQSWFAQGVTLGQLLHSVALAPGESTRVAMIDWSRRVQGRQSETENETEDLSNLTEHSRATREVTSAVAREAQEGFSKTHVQSSSDQEGTGWGVSVGPVTFGDSSGEANTQSNAMSFSSSAGQRDLSASMAQNVLDRTQQHASAARNRRATVVKEVSQAEHEKISTRVVTNYNHMHALSVQYYEIVQIYRVVVRLARVEQCLFVPMKPIDFGNDALVRKFRKILARSPIDSEGRDLLTNDFSVVGLKTRSSNFLEIKGAALVPFTVKDAGKTIELPNDAKVTKVYFIQDAAGLSLSLGRRDGTDVTLNKTTTKDFLVQDSASLHELADIYVDNGGAEVSLIMTVGLNYKGVSFWVEVSFVAAAGRTRVIWFSGGGVRSKLTEHLHENSIYYSDLIYRSLDPATVTLLLAGYSFRGRPVAQQVDPQPIATAGNYLVLRTHLTADAESDDQQAREWADWLADHGVDAEKVTEDLVPMPSGGVFAEAVLGRYNSAEKLEFGRFWNWQDSPIPLTAPEIAPLQAGSRSEGDIDLTAKGFSQPLVNIVSPTALPDPAGLTPALQAIANGNMFRDMSGLAATIGLAQSGIQATSDAATSASVQAGSNLATAAKKDVEKFKAALAFVAAMYGRGSTDTSPSTISNEGAKVNYGRSLDARKSALGSDTAAPLAGQTTVTGTPGTIQQGAVSNTSAPAEPGHSNEQAAFDRALYGPAGASHSELLQQVSDTTSDSTPNTKLPPILPSIFDFVVKKMDDDKSGTAGGWMETSCLEFGYRHSRLGVNVRIPLRVGCPVRTQAQGKISIPYAQRIAAEAATTAAEAMLMWLDSGMPPTSVPVRFRSVMQEDMKLIIHESKVQNCDGGFQPHTHAVVFVQNPDDSISLTIEPHGNIV